jgi:hypothetical protein
VWISLGLLYAIGQLWRMQEVIVNTVELSSNAIMVRKLMVLLDYIYGIVQLSCCINDCKTKERSDP